MQRYELNIGDCSGGLLCFDSGLLEDPGWETGFLLNDFLGPSEERDQEHFIEACIARHGTKLSVILVQNFMPVTVAVEQGGPVNKWSDIKESIVSYLSCPSRKIIVCDAGVLINEAGIDERNAIVIPVESDRCAITVNHLRYPRETLDVVGFFNKATPSIAIQISDRRDPCPDFHALIPLKNHLEEATILSPYKKCHARTRKIQDGMVTLDLLLSPTMSSGYGRFKIGHDSDNLSVGDPLLVRLEEYTGNYWHCSLISKE
ncbi:MAG: hypothetical protein H8F28_25355 [Fibrella sp.]|nr:hypothetical protein [Armatimonadota bacterium]